MVARDRATKKQPKASSVRKLLRSADDLYGAGESTELMRGEYTERTDIHELIQKRHRKGASWINKEGYWVRHDPDHRWKVPYGIRVALKERLYWSQIATKYPFYVTWVSPKTRKRLKKSFMSLPAAIDFIASKAQYVDPNASIVSKHGFYIPRKLMGKFPRRMGSPARLFYWCPRCMEPRTFRRNGEETHAMKKFLVWNDKARAYVYEWKDVKLAVICCTTCGISNRDSKFRASNQPVEKRRFKQGVRRAKPKKRRQ